MLGLRRLRGALGMAMTWAVAAIPVGLVFAITRWGLNGEIYDFTDFERLSWELTDWGMTGLLSGLIFAALFAVSERGLEVKQLSGWRTAFDGALAGGLGYYASFFALVGSTFQGSLLQLVEALATPASVSAVAGSVIALGLRQMALSGSEDDSGAGLSPSEVKGLAPSWDWDVELNQTESRARTPVG